MGIFSSKKSQRISTVQMQTPQKLHDSQKETMLQAYARMEAAISEAERSLVAPRLLANILELQQLDQDLIEFKSIDEKPHEFSTAQENGDLKQVIDDLKLFIKPESSVEHEEFIANINRQTIKRVSFQWTAEKKTEVENAKRNLEVQVSDLQVLYREMYLMFTKTIGIRRMAGSASAAESHLESRLSASRSLRDSLAAAVLSWRAAAATARRSSAHAAAALHGWRLVPHSISSSDRSSLCGECIARIARSLCGVRSACRALKPRASAPHCTPRLLRDIRSTLAYALTDSFDVKRYEATTILFCKYKDATTLLSQWIHQTLKNTLEKDLSEVEDDIEKLSTELRSLRVNLIASKGLTETYYKQPPEIKQLYRQTAVVPTRAAIKRADNKVSFAVD